MDDKTCPQDFVMPSKDMLKVRDLPARYMFMFFFGFVIGWLWGMFTILGAL